MPYVYCKEYTYIFIYRNTNKQNKTKNLIKLPEIRRLKEFQQQCKRQFITEIKITFKLEKFSEIFLSFFCVAYLCCMLCGICVCVGWCTRNLKDNFI